MQGYAHLAQEERCHIELMRGKEVSIRRIATGMHRSPSTVSRDLVRKAGQRGCRHKQVEGKARERLKAKPKCVNVTQEAVAFVKARLADGWSPDQIRGQMKAEGMPSASHEAISRHVWRDKANGGWLAAPIFAAFSQESAQALWEVRLPGPDSLPHGHLRVSRRGG